jgi:sugar lactone lactonase YvrE
LIDVDGSVKKLLDGILLSNGMGFSLDHKVFYHTDSPARTITQYDYDIESGDIKDPRFAYLKTCKDLKVYPKARMLIRDSKYEKTNQ